MKQFTVSEDCSLKNFTDNHYAQASFCFRALLREREIRVNGVRVSADIPLHAGDEVKYFLTPARDLKPAFITVYEDGNVLVADKESGVNSEAVFAALSERGETYFIHRLDRNTAGLLLFGKNPQAAAELLRLFRDRSVQKTYLAVVLGSMPSRHAIERAYLKKDGDGARVFVSNAPIGEPIVTEYEVLETHAETSLLKVTLHTGKTHQIRAHLAFLKHPVAGDEKYGNSAFNRAHSLTRQQLVAKQLSLQSNGFLNYLNGKTFISAREL